MSITRLSLFLFFGGLVFVASDAWENRIRPSRLKVPTEAELSVAAGTAAAARVVEHKTRKGVLASKYAELDVRSSEGSVTVRVTGPNAERLVSGIGGQAVTATYDPREQNFVYALTAGGRSLVSYQDTAAYKQQLAASERGGGRLAWVTVVLGAAGFVLSRMLGSRPAKTR